MLQLHFNADFYLFYAKQECKHFFVLGRRIYDKL